MTEGNPERTVVWSRQRYLAEHWGRVMAAQDDLIVADYRAKVEGAIRDLLAAETFGPKTVIAALSRVATERSWDAHASAQSATKARSARLRANGGCPVCADTEKPDPRTHQNFHDRMTKPATTYAEDKP